MAQQTTSFSTSNLLRLAASLLIFSHPQAAAQNVTQAPAPAPTGPPGDLGSVLAGEPTLSTYYNLIKKYPQILLQLPSYAGVTIIAPSNEAFTQIPYTSLNSVWDDSKAEIAVPILQYHMIQGTLPASSLSLSTPVFPTTFLTDPAWTTLSKGQGLVIHKQPPNEVVVVSGDGSRSSMGKRDIPFTGGLIHIVDSLLVPPGALNDTLTKEGDMSFLGALYAGDVYSDLASCSNCTIFVASNSAFQAVNETLSGLDSPTLNKVLRYHVVPGQVLHSTDLMNGTSLETLESGLQLHISRDANNLYINSATVVQTDMLLSNGIIHVLDNVLNPNASKAVPDPNVGLQTPVYNQYVDISTLINTNLPFTTAFPCTSDCPVPTASVTSNGTNATWTTATMTRTTHSTSTSHGAAAGIIARCTGLSMAASAAGAVGIAMVGFL